MKKILLKINKSEINFQYKTNNYKAPDLINTNIISNNELIFTEDYLQENMQIVSTFIKELTNQYHVFKATIKELELAPLITKLLKNTSIYQITILEDVSLTYTFCEELIKLNQIKLINCFTLQPFMLELLDKHNIECLTRSEILYISNFMEINNLFSFSNIYYKTSVKVNLPLSNEDLTDFKNFCKINKYLKVIHINHLIMPELNNIIKVLKEVNKRNIRLIIHENVSDGKVAEYLKSLNKKYKHKYQISLTLEYSQDYLSKNIFKQAITNTLRTCGLIISSLVILIITYIGVSNYVSLKQVETIKDDLAQIVEITDPQDIIKKKNEENIEKAENDENIPVEEVKLVTNEELASLLSVNEDVIGELKVNNLDIEYPILQSTDNDYYLNHDINHNKSITGWLFMDYRNDSMNLNKNNIIYGHNAYYSGVMFGTLYKAANKNWYTKPENQIITYNTLYEDMQFRIFSIYKVPKTSDYLKVYFDDDYEFLDFIDMITKRSIYDFNVPIKATDKIITLSTCSDNGSKRLVIHAVLMNNTKGNS